MSQPPLNIGVQNNLAAGTVLVAAICGTDAADDCVLSFTNAQTVNAAINGITITNAAGPGTQVALAQPGVYYAVLNYAPEAGGAVNTLGISRNATAGERGGDAPAVPNFATMWAVGRTLAPAATDGNATLSAIIPVTAALASAAGGCIIRGHAGDGAGATPAGGDVVEARCWYAITKINQLDA